ncbi:MAG: cytochrome P450 [Sphingopyxis sp.]|nr:cytochrome P450 [Sphingopyxis sp.]
MSIDVDTLNLASLAFWRRPDRMNALAALRRDKPVSWHEMSEEPERGMKGFWSVTRYADVLAVSNSPDFISGQGTYMGDQSATEARAEGWFLNMDAPEHTRLRQIVARAFTPRGIDRMRTIAEDHACAMVGRVRDQGACDFVSEIAQPYPVEVVCDFLGAPREDRRHLHQLTMVALAADAHGADHLARIPAAFAELNAYGAMIARDRRRRPEGEDILSLIVHSEIDGRKLSDEEAGMFFQLLVTAGMETTGTAGGHLMRLLLENRDQMAIWRNDPDATALLGVEELVRYVSPIMHMRRTAIKDCQIADQRIAAGDKVVMWYISANRDEAKFADAERFDVRRKPNPHLGFGGGGRHICLGMHLARMELPILAKAMLTQLRDIEPAGDPVLLPSRFVNGIASMPIRYRAG